MTQKKLVIYFISIISLIIAPLPVINTILFFSKKSEQITYNKQYLFSTDSIESTVNYYLYKNVQMSLNKNLVIVGKNDFLFLGNKYGKVLDKVQALYPYTLEEIDLWTNKLKRIQTWYENKNIKYIMVIVPNKHSVYKDKLPTWVKTNNKTITDVIVNNAKQKNINLFDLRNIFKVEKENDQLYFTTDTHWNNKGAAIGYDKTIKYINRIYTSNYKTIPYKFTTTYGGSGDLANFLKINALLPLDYEENYTFEFENESKVCQGKIHSNQDLLACINKKNPPMNIHKGSEYIINKTAVNKEKLLLLCDSFANTHAKLYNETFHTIWKFHYNNLHGVELSNFVSKQKPNIIIHQIAERYLYNDNIVESLSQETN